SRFRPALWLAALALVAGGVAWFLRPPPVAAPPPIFDIPDAPAVSGGAPVAGATRELTGGVFEGVVVDAKGAPVRDADVFLAGKRNKTLKIPNPIIPDVPGDPTATNPDLEIQQVD